MLVTVDLKFNRCWRQRRVCIARFGRQRDRRWPGEQKGCRRSYFSAARRVISGRRFSLSSMTTPMLSQYFLGWIGVTDGAYRHIWSGRLTTIGVAVLRTTTQ
jgi:hypothetical protein